MALRGVVALPGGQAVTDDQFREELIAAINRLSSGSPTGPPSGLELVAMAIAGSTFSEGTCLVGAVENMSTSLSSIADAINRVADEMERANP